MAKCSLRPVVSAAILPTSTVSPTIKNKTKLGALRMAAVVLALGVVCPLAAHAVGSASQMVVLSQPTLLPFNNNSYVYNFFSGGTAGLFTVAEEDANNNIVVDGGGISLTISSSGGTCYLGTTSGSVTTATVSTTSPLSSNTTYPYTITPTYSNGVATFDLSTLNLNATGSVCTYGFKFSGVNNSVSTSGTASSPGTGTGNLSPIELVAPTSNLFIVTTNVDPGSSPSCPAFTTMQTTATLALSANNNCPFRTAFSNMKNTASAQVIFYSSAWPMTITLASTLDGTNNTAPLFVIGPGPNNLFISGGCAVGSSPAVGSGCASNTVGGIKGGSTSTSAATFLEGFTMENFHDGSTSGAVNLTGGPNLFNNMNFDYNEYDGGGGAIAIGKYAPTGTLINNSQFIGNTSSLTNTAASGGGISYVGNGPLSITNSLIVANSNVGNWTSSNGGQLIGGALYMKPGQTIVNVGASAYNLANDSFIGNYVSQTGTQGNSTGGHSGAAFYATQSASLTAASGVYVTNDTMYGNFSSTNTTSYTYGAVYTICSSCAATMTDYITSSLFTGNAAANSNTTSSNTYPVRGGAWYQSSTNTTVYNSVMEGDLVFDAGCTVSGSCNTTVYGPDDNASSFTAGTATDLTTTGSTGSWASGHTYPGVGALGSGSTVDGLGLSDLGMGVGFVQITAAGSYTSGARLVKRLHGAEQQHRCDDDPCVLHGDAGGHGGDEQLDVQFGHAMRCDRFDDYEPGRGLRGAPACDVQQRHGDRRGDGDGVPVRRHAAVVDEFIAVHVRRLARDVCAAAGHGDDRTGEGGQWNSRHRRRSGERLRNGAGGPGDVPGFVHLRRRYADDNVQRRRLHHGADGHGRHGHRQRHGDGTGQLHERYSGHHVGRRMLGQPHDGGLWREQFDVRHTGH